MRARLGVVAVWSAATWWACGSSTPADLEINVSPTSITSGVPIQVTITATNADGTVGTGSAQITSSAGSLSGGAAVMLDSFGSAHTQLDCDPSTEDACAGTVRVVATWTPKGGMALTAEADLKPKPPVVPVVYQTAIDPICATDAGRTVDYPDAGVLAPLDVPSDCSNGFELNNATGRGTYTIHAKTSEGSRAITLDVDFATYKAPDAMRVTAINGSGHPYVLIDSCRLQTATVGDPTNGASRPPDDTIRQMRVDVQPGTTDMTFDFSGVGSPMYLRVLGLCDFTLTPYASAARWKLDP